MDYTIIIISNKTNQFKELLDNILEEKNLKIDYLIIDSANFIDSNLLTYNNEPIYYNYLIFDDLNLIQNLKEQLLIDNDIITNYYYETSIDNIFYIKENKKSLIDKIIDYIINNF